MALGFHKLTVAEIRRETDDAIAIRLIPAEDARAQFAFRPGQHLTLRHQFDEEDVRRTYSVCAAPSEGELWVAIKRIKGGLFSNWANNSLAVGDEIEAMVPHGSFTWHFEARHAARYLGIAAGSGITPILSLVKSMLLEEPDSTFTLLYGNHHSGSIMFLEQLAALKNRYMGRLQVHHFLSAEEEEIDLFNGRLDVAKLTEVVERLVDPKVIDVAFLCGPGAMMEAARTVLVGAGMKTEAVLAERFAADRHVDDPARRAHLAVQSQGRKISVTLEGRKRSITFDAERGSILESARAAGMPAPYACKAGVCATCRAKLVSGKVHMDANFGLTGEELEQGYILTCQSAPLTDNVAVDFDA